MKKQYISYKEMVCAKVRMYIPFPYVYTASLYKKMVRSMKKQYEAVCTYRFFVQRNGTYALFLHIKKRFSLYQEMVHMYLFFIQRNGMLIGASLSEPHTSDTFRAINHVQKIRK